MTLTSGTAPWGSTAAGGCRSTVEGGFGPGSAALIVDISAGNFRDEALSGSPCVCPGGGGGRGMVIRGCMVGVGLTAPGPSVESAVGTVSGAAGVRPATGSVVAVTGVIEAAVGMVGAFGKPSESMSAARIFTRILPNTFSLPSLPSS